MERTVMWDYIYRVIVENIRGRQLVLRWKNQEFEEYLQNKGLMPSFYVTMNPKRIDKGDTFSDAVLRNHPEKYYLVICPDLARNEKDTGRYLRMGFAEGKDFIWARPDIKELLLDGTEKNASYRDCYGNIVDTESSVHLRILGTDNHIKIGKNVVLPQSPIVIGSKTEVIIGDNSKVNSSAVTINDCGTLHIGRRVTLGEMEIFVNRDSGVYIGDKTTTQSGILRTGRNQIVRIGKDCMFSWDVVFIPHDGHLIWDLHTGTPENNTIGEQRESIIIGDHVWVGGECVFLPNTTVRTGSICAYRSSLKGSYPNNCIIGGSPAKVLKKDKAWTRSNISYDDHDLLKLNSAYRQETTDLYK